MNKLPLYAILYILLSCIACSTDRAGNEITYVEIQLNPSFAETATFILTADRQIAVIEENWRLSDSVDTLHKYEKTSKFDFRDFQVIRDELLLDTNLFKSNCDVLDGLSLSGEIKTKVGESYKFLYQDCYHDTVAHKLTQILIENLMAEFQQDTVTSHYLLEMYHDYYQGTALPMDSIQIMNSPLTKLRQKAWKKYHP